QVYYGRELRLHEPWDVRRLLLARNGGIERLELEPGEEVASFEEAEEVLEVWDIAPDDLPAREVSLEAPISAESPDTDAG
ncbi:MAG: hypothetical protein ABFC89_03200, partial [Methanospirillum sp.]